MFEPPGAQEVASVTEKHWKLGKEEGMRGHGDARVGLRTGGSWILWQLRQGLDVALL